MGDLPANPQVTNSNNERKVVMKMEHNRALVAEKKIYQIPSVILTQLMPSTIILAGSGNVDMGGGGGGGIDPD
jgi:hypothetical protein